MGADKRAQYKVKDPTRYAFDPKDIVAKICSIYVNLSKHDARNDFFLAVSEDKRSYSPALFRESVLVLRNYVNDIVLADGLEDLAKDVELAEWAQNEEEELLAGEDVPGEFMDPLMATLMREPVTFPSPHERFFDISISTMIDFQNRCIKFHHGKMKDEFDLFIFNKSKEEIYKKSINQSRHPPNQSINQ